MAFQAVRSLAGGALAPVFFVVLKRSFRFRRASWIYFLSLPFFVRSLPDKKWSDKK